MKSRKLIAAIACRNKSSRLYAKPLQTLDIKKKISVINFIISNLKKQKIIKEIVLGISDKPENSIYKSIARKHKIKYILGSDKDVLKRLIRCGKVSKATDVFRITSESPFTYLTNLKQSWIFHIKNKNDATFLDNIIDGCGYEIITMNALGLSHKNGYARHRSELCTLYIRENKKKFKIGNVEFPNYLKRNDLRLTIDYPEDLIVCREIYKKKIDSKKKINFKSIINFLDKRKDLKLLTKKFTYLGLKSMYL